MEFITDINQLDCNKTYTYADYLTWRFKERIELIKGKIFRMSPAPSTRHQEITGALFGTLYHYFKHNPCKVFVAPFDVRLSKNIGKEIEIETIIQPDICIVCDLSKLDSKGYQGVPELIIEVLSSSTSSKDTRDKFNLYEENGVKEYWIVYPGEHLIDIYKLGSDKRYRFIGKYSKEDTISPERFDNLSISLKDIFEEETTEDTNGTFRL